MTLTQTDRRLFSVSDYHKMAQAGVFAPDERVELLEGELRRMSPVGGKHIRIVANLTRALVHALSPQYDILVQSPIRLSDYSEPQPDAAVIRRFEQCDDPNVPPAADVFLVVEVSDSTLAFDRDVKVPLYAAAGIPEVWLIDVQKEAVAQYLEPQDGEYRRYTLWRGGEMIPSPTGAAIAVSDLLLPS